MFIFVIAGYFLSVILLCCGIANAYALINSAHQSMGIYLFLNLLATALLPALGGLFLIGLIQIAKFLEELVFEQRFAKISDIQESSPKTERTNKKESEEPTSYFGEVSQSERSAKPQAHTPSPPSFKPTNNAAPTDSSAPENLSFFHID